MTAANVASTAEIRAHFPALTREHNGFPVAYFDGPGGTQVPRAVVDAMSEYLFQHNANTHWSYPTSRETDEILAAARTAFADFFNASPDEIVFGQNMTALTFHLARSLGRSHFQPGDEIIVTELDHHANVDSWRALEKERGVRIRVAPMNVGGGTLDFPGLEALFNENTRLLAVGAASNALGTITDVGRACRLARKAGALSFVDAVHYASHNLIDVEAFGCDFLACSAYKFYGPHVGVLYGRRELLEKIDFPKLRPAPDDVPERAEIGTQNHEGIAGAAAAVDFLASLADGRTRREKLRNTFGELDRRKKELMKIIWEGLSAVKGARLYGPPYQERRTPTVAFTLEGMSSTAVTERLVERGIFTSHGNFYALTVVEKLNLGEEGLVRVGCACYTTPDEAARLVEAVRALRR